MNILYLLIFLISTVSLTFVVTYKSDKKLVKIISYILCFTISISMFVSVNVKAVEKQERFTIKREINVEDQTYNIKAKIMYNMDSSGFTENEVSDYTEMSEGILKVEKKYKNIMGYVKDEDIDDLLSEICEYLEELKEENIVESYNNNNGTIAVNLTSGIGYLFSPAKKGRFLNSGTDCDIVTLEPAHNKVVTQIGYFQAFLDIKFNELGYQDSYSLSDNAEKVEQTFNEYKYKSKVQNSNVDIDQLKELNKYSMIIWEGHGDYNDEYNSVLITREKASWILEDTIYREDISEKRMIITGDGHCAISSKFVDEYIRNMNSSVVYLGACVSGKDDVLAKSFLSNGAKAVYGYNENVSIPYEIMMRTYTILSLCNKDENGKYNNVQQALDNAKRLINDKDFYADDNPAELVLFSNDFNYSLDNKYITGTVKSIDTNEVIRNARIEVNDNSYEVNEKGEFLIYLPSGEYSLTITSPDYEEKTISNIIVNDNESKNLSDVFLTVKDIWDMEYPKYPSDISQKYWIIFNEGYRNGRVEMAVFDVKNINDNTHIIWDRNLKLNDHSKFSNCDQYYIDENVWKNFINNYRVMSDYATNVLASNLDIYNKDGELILAKKQYNSK